MKQNSPHAAGRVIADLQGRSLSVASRPAQHQNHKQGKVTLGAFYHVKSGGYRVSLTG